MEKNTLTLHLPSYSINTLLQLMFLTKVVAYAITRKINLKIAYIIQRHVFPFRAPIRLSFLVHASGMDGSFGRSLTKQIDGIYEQWKGYCSVAKWTQKFPRVGVVNLTLADASIRKLSTQGTRQGGANCQVRVGGPSHVQTFRFAV